MYSPVISLAVRILPTLPFPAAAVSGVSCHSWTGQVYEWQVPMRIVRDLTMKWCSWQLFAPEWHRFWAVTCLGFMITYPLGQENIFFIWILMDFRIKRVFYWSNLKIYGKKRNFYKLKSFFFFNWMHKIANRAYEKAGLDGESLGDNVIWQKTGENILGQMVSLCLPSKSKFSSALAMGTKTGVYD